MAVLVVGSIAMDTIRMPDGSEHREVLGGSCTYFSCAAALFAPVRVVGVVGEDFEERHVQLLAGHGIDLEGLQRLAGGKTFRWAGTYSEDMNVRTTDDLQFGVLAEFDPVLPAAYRDSRFVFLACAQPEVQLKVMDQVRDDAVLVSDTIEFYIENQRPGLERVLARSHGVIINDGEARLYTGEQNLVRAAAALLANGPRFVIVKKGEHGGLLAVGGPQGAKEPELYPFPAYPLAQVVDPTGAGDSFAGGFMGFLARTGNTDTATLRRAVLHGTATASFACQGIGLQRLAAVSAREARERAEDFRRRL